MLARLAIAIDRMNGVFTEGIVPNLCRLFSSAICRTKKIDVQYLKVTIMNSFNLRLILTSIHPRLNTEE